MGKRGFSPLLNRGSDLDFKWVEQRRDDVAFDSNLPLASHAFRAMHNADMWGDPIRLMSLAGNGWSHVKEGQMIMACRIICR